MKTSLLFLTLCIISIHAFSQTGYFEFADYESQSYKGDIQKSNDGHLIIVNENTIQKMDEEGNIIWRTEIGTTNFIKLFVVPSDGYFVYGINNLEHFSEEGESLLYRTIDITDFGYTYTDFSDGISLTDLYFNGSGFTCVGWMRNDTAAWDPGTYYWMKFELATDCSVLWHDEHFIGEFAAGVSYQFMVHADDHDDICYTYFDGTGSHLQIDKTPTGSGDVLSTVHAPGILIKIFPVHDGSIVYSYGPLPNQKILTKVLAGSGDTAWTKSIITPANPFNFLAELESGNFVALRQEYYLLTDSTYESLQYYSSEGDSLITYPPFLEFEDVAMDKNFLHGLITLDGGRLAFAGYNFHTYRAFLLITDTLGHFYHVNLTGKLYNDANTNGVFDADETVFAHQMVKSEPVTYFGFTNENGDYNMLLGKDTAYTISVLPVAGWDIVDPDPLSVTITTGMDGDTITGTDFHLDYTTAVHDVAVYLYQHQIAPGFATSAVVSITNQGNQYDESGTLTLHFPSILTDPVTSPDFFSLDDTIITWNYADLDPYETQTFNVSYLVDTLLYMIGENVFTRAEVSTASADADTADNNDVWNEPVVSSCDPNHKTVAPAGEGEAGNINYETNDLTYTIEFQNTGTAETHFINIYDTLDAALNIESLEMLAASDNYELQIIAPDILRWKFDPINLPDSASDPAGSTGYLTFRIQLKEAAGIGDVIENTAGIYFDYNPVVLTNTVKNTLVDPVAITDVPVSQLLFSIYPNPAEKDITISFTENTTEVIEILITDIAGKRCLSDQMQSNLSSKTLQISELKTGNYFITLKSNRKEYGTIPISVTR